MAMSTVKHLDLTMPPRCRAKSRRESALETRAVAWARARGVQVGKLTECVGLPDRIFFTPRAKGGPLIIEFKRRGEEPEPAQEWHLAEMGRKGYIIGWCDTWEGFIEAIRKQGVK